MVEQVRYQAAGSDFMDAFRSTRAAKNVFLIILLLSILVQIAAFVAVFFLDVVDPIHKTASRSAVVSAAQDEAPSARASAQPTTTQAADRSEERSHETAVFVDEVLKWALPGARFFALVSSVLLCLTLLTSLKLCMLERLSGIGLMASAFYWSLVLLAMVTPWQQILHGEVACGALYNKGEFYGWVSRVKPSWAGSRPDIWGQVLFYARFLGYPVLALLIWLVVQLKFAKGFRNLSPTTAPAGKRSRNQADEVTTPDLPLEDLQ